jgi:hypothetical protein
MNKQELADSIKLGDKVTILIPNGIGRDGPEYKEATGRCSFAPGGPGHYAVLNMGGWHRVAIASAQNIVRIGKRIPTD